MLFFCNNAVTQSASINRKPWIGLVFLIALFLVKDSTAENAAVQVGTEIDEHGEHFHPSNAVLFPCFVLTLGVMVYYVLSRYLHFLPYTGIMFILGTIMGCVASSDLMRSEDKSYMNDTLVAWGKINSHVLLLVFLPGLIFKDALGQNPNLFALSFGQLLIFAFPMVLAGTCLTALIGLYIFDYEWSTSLCFVFGSILSATDPVAVAALLDEVGAPPRMKTHIAGESLLNDGAAIVFFHIFEMIFLSEFDIPGVGDVIGLGKGVKIFCQMAIGGMAIGLVAGASIILLLHLFNRRFGTEENIVQVCAVLGMAYLNYFVAEVVCKSSGVIATVFAGLVVKFFGRGSINNVKLMDDFFSITEHILNTILFTLGGLVWGNVIILNQKNGLWRGKDWGYLILLYVLLHVIRGVLFVVAYPITVRIGLKTNWKETSFQIYGGLRGAVGIALAIAIDNETKVVAENYDEDFSAQTDAVRQLYQMVGGIALLTLAINGTTAGPMLIKLGLAESSEARHRIIEAYRVHLRAKMIVEFVELLTSEKYKNIDYAFVEKHVPFLSDLTLEQLVESVEALKDTTPSLKYRPPHLEGLLKHLKHEDSITSNELAFETYDILKEDPQKYAREQRMKRRKMARGSMCRSSMVAMMQGNPLSTKELRLLFISMVRAQYELQVSEGMLTSQHGLTIALQQSLEEAEADADKGKPLNDLHHLRKYHGLHLKFKVLFKKATCNTTIDHVDLQSAILKMYAFARAHEHAQEFFQEQLGECDKDLSVAGNIVLSESRNQVKEVIDELDCSDNEDFVIIVSTHKLCEILLNKGIKYIETLQANGLLKDSETEEMVEEMAHHLNEVKQTKLELSGRRNDGPVKNNQSSSEGNETKNHLDVVEEA